MSAGFSFNQDKVVREFERLVGRGLRGAAQFAANRVKEVVSVPAPRRRLRVGESRIKRVLKQRRESYRGLPKAERRSLTDADRKMAKAELSKSRSYLVATEAATPGAPPRKLSGTLRSRITHEVISELVARVGLRLDYGAVHEYGLHPYLGITIEAYQDQIMELIGKGG